MYLLYFASLVVIFLKSIARAQDPQCESGEYLIDRVCCPMCDRGNRVQRPCKDTTSGATSCIPCMSGTYMDHPSGLTECFKCKSCDSGSGLRVKSGCTYIRNTVCSCMDGYYCLIPATEDCDLCERHTVCDAGKKVKVPGTERSDTICERCPTGTFSSQNMSNSCFTWTSCRDLGRKEKAPGTHKKDVECGEPIRSRPGLIAAVVVLSLVFIITLIYECRNTRNTTGYKTAKSHLPVQDTNPSDAETCPEPAGYSNNPNTSEPLQSTTTTSDDQLLPPNLVLTDYKTTPNKSPIQHNIHIPVQETNPSDAEMGPETALCCNTPNTSQLPQSTTTTSGDQLVLMTRGGNKSEEVGPKKMENRITEDGREDTDATFLEVETEPEKGRTAQSPPADWMECPNQRRTASEDAEPKSCDGWGREDEEEEWHIAPEEAV